MRLQNGLLQVEIVVDETFSFNSTDNKPYDFILNPDNLIRRDWTKVFSITIKENNRMINIALVGSFLSYPVDSCAVLDGYSLIILMNTAVTVINTSVLKIEKHKHLPDFGTYFSIYKFDDGYIVYGELDIVKLNKNFDVEWTFSGSDIFVTLDGKTAFEIVDETINLIDWNGVKYKLNKLGQEISNYEN